MPTLLGVIGAFCWLFAGFALMIGFTTGTDIQLIAAAVWGTFGGVCIGSAAIISELRSLQKSLDRPVKETPSSEPTSDGWS